MLLSVSQGDCWPPSISGKRTFQCRFILLLVPFFASCYVTRSTSYRLCTLASPWLRRSSPGSWLLFQLYSILWVSVCVDPSTHGRSSFWDCRPSQVFQPHTFPGSAVSVGRLRFHLFPGFSVGGSHLSAAFCDRRLYVLRLAYRELVAVASRRSFFTSSPSSGRLAFFLRWLASFLAATWDCSPSSSASIVPGTVRIWRLQSWRRWSVFTVSSGGSFSLVSLSACLCTKCLLSFTFGSDASGVGWGAHLDCRVASGLLDTRQAALSLHARGLLAVQLGLFQFRSPLRGRTVVVFCDDSTAGPSLR